MARRDRRSCAEPGFCVLRAPTRSAAGPAARKAIATRHPHSRHFFGRISHGRRIAAGHCRGAHQLRRPRVRAVPEALVHQVHGLFGRTAAPSGGGHRLQSLGVQQLPSRDAGARRRRQARRARRRRTADRLPDHFPGRGVSQSHQPHVPQSHEHGRGGDGAGPADGRGGPDRRLRQDGSGAADGRRRGRSAGRATRHGADDDRPAQRRTPGRLHRLPPLLGQFSRRQDRPARNRRGRGPAGDDGGHLRGDGNGQHHGLHRRGIGHVAARHGRDPGRACRPAACRRSQRRCCRCADRPADHGPAR